MHFDIIIVGGGVIGLTLAAALSKKDFKIALIEKIDINERNKQNSDGRASAIASVSKNILDEFGLWESIIPHSNPINEIRITDSDSPLFLHFDNTLIDKEPLGYMVDNHTFLKELYENLLTSNNVKILTGKSWTKINQTPYNIEIELDTGEKLSGNLIVAADGKRSKLRDYFGFKVHSWKYNQTAIICNIEHEQEHMCIAQERFLPAGPFAVLPLKGGNKSAIVWTESEEIADIYLKMQQEDFTYFLAKKFGNYFGNIKLISKVFSYPLSASYTTSYYKERVALIGDAAHSIHPIAGQGLNLGIRDVKVFVDIMINYKKLGIDIGSQIPLAEYQKLRLKDNLAMLAITDGFDKLFSNNSKILRNVRRLGLITVNKLPKLQRFFMRYAMGERK